MKRKLSNVLIVLILLVSVDTLICQTFNKDFEDGKIYFKLKNSYQNNSLQSKNNGNSFSGFEFLGDIISRYSVESITKAVKLKRSNPSLDRIFLMKFNNITEIDNLINDMTGLEMIDYAEKCSIVRQDFQPNDTLYNFTKLKINWNWYLDRIQAEKAWDITTGSPNIRVAIIDNMIWSDHEDLKDKIVAEYNAITGATGKLAAAPPSSAPTSGKDGYSWSHGTHTAGVAGASTNNHIGVASIGYNISLMAVRVADNTNVMLETVTNDGVQWAADNGANIINLSLGQPTSDQTQELILQQVKDAYGIVTLASAGNAGTNAVQYPANYPSVISVGSTDDNDNLSSFSQYGSWVNIAAPGGTATSGSNQIAILSTSYSDSYYVSQVIGAVKYETMSGTSESSPIVAGICGLMLSLKPGLTPDQVKTCLFSTTDPIAGTHTIGGGRVNAYKALQCVQNTRVVVKADFKADLTSIYKGQTVHFSDMSTDFPTSWKWKFEGGKPDSSSLKDPVVTYDSTGVFSVTLHASNDESDSTLTKSAYLKVTDPADFPCDSIFNFYKGDKYLIYLYGGTKDWGYCSGHNSSGFIEYAEKITLTTIGQIKSIGLGVYRSYAAKPSSKITIKVWEGGSLPGLELASKDVLLNTLKPGMRSIDLDIPVEITTGNCYIGYELYYNSPVDTFAVLQSSIRGTSKINTAYFNFQKQWNPMTILTTTKGAPLYSSLDIRAMECGVGVNIVENAADNSNIVVFPNPAKDNVYVQLKNNTGKRTVIYLYDLYGKELRSYENVDRNKAITEVDISDLPEGVYFISIRTDDSFVSERILKIN